MVTLLTQNLPAADVSIQFAEPYVSRGLNRKAAGVIPAGIFRGYNPSAVGMTVTIGVNAPTTDSVAVCDTLSSVGVANGFNVTARHEADIVLDFTTVAIYPNFVVLEARYDITSLTPLQGMTSLQVKVVEPVDVLPQHVVICRTTLVGPNVIIDTSVEERTGGPVLVPNDVAVTRLVSTVYTAGNVGSGGFSLIPGTLLNFTQTKTGPAYYVIGASTASDSTDGSIGVFEDAATAFQGALTSGNVPVGGGAWRRTGLTTFISRTLTAGPHSAQVFIQYRGFGPFSAMSVSGNVTDKLYFSVFHS